MSDTNLKNENSENHPAPTPGGGLWHRHGGTLIALMAGLLLVVLMALNMK